MYLRAGRSAWAWVFVFFVSCQGEARNAEVGHTGSALSSDTPKQHKPVREIMFVLDGSDWMGGQCKIDCNSQCQRVCQPTDDFQAQKQGLIDAIESIPLGAGYSVGVVLSEYGDFDEDPCVMWGTSLTGCAGRSITPHIDPLTGERKGAPRLIVPLRPIATPNDVAEIKFRAHRHPINGYRLYRRDDLLRLLRKICGSAPTSSKRVQTRTA